MRNCYFLDILFPCDGILTCSCMLVIFMVPLLCFVCRDKIIASPLHKEEKSYLKLYFKEPMLISIVVCRRFWFAINCEKPEAIVR